MYKVGDRVVVIKHYPSDLMSATYKVGDVVTLEELRFTISDQYWYTTSSTAKGISRNIGIFSSHFRPLTSLDEALK